MPGTVSIFVIFLHLHARFLHLLPFWYRDDLHFHNFDISVFGIRNSIDFHNFGQETSSIFTIFMFEQWKIGIKGQV